MCGWGLPRIFHLGLILVDRATGNLTSELLWKRLVHKMTTRIDSGMIIALDRGSLIGLECPQSLVSGNFPTPEAPGREKHLGTL
jgi:hypothetical protein